MLLHGYDFDTFAAEYAHEFTAAVRKASIGFMSVIRPDLLREMIAQPERFFRDFGADAEVYYKQYPALLAVKNEFFDFVVREVANGNAHLAPQAAKGVTNQAQFNRFITLLQEHTGQPSHAPLLIYPGSFDPMHYGHRTLISSLIEQSPPHAMLAININSLQSRKPHLAQTYERRFANLEHHMLKSMLLDPYRVCAMDFRFGAEPHEDHLRQTRLQAYMAGDARLRWVIGGDKFLFEADRRNKEEAAGVPGRTISRFNLDTMSMYVVPRKGNDIPHIQQLVAEFNAAYPAEFICVIEKEYDGRPISSTFIRTHTGGKDAALHTEARDMEHADLTRTYHE